MECFRHARDGRKKTGARGPGGEIRVKDGHQLPDWTMFSYVCLQINQTRQVNE